jgi:hypothetical protein
MFKVITTVSIYCNAQFASKPKETQHNYVMNNFMKICTMMSTHIINTHKLSKNPRTHINMNTFRM